MTLGKAYAGVDCENLGIKSDNSQDISTSTRTHLAQKWSAVLRRRHF